MDIQYDPNLVVDCANGSGGLLASKVAKRIQSYLTVTIVNDKDIGVRLNHDCGSDFVLKSKREPMSLNPKMPNRVACFDGDAQRLVYIQRIKNKPPKILDGDKQFGLIMHYIKL